MEMKGEMDISIIRVEDFNSPLVTDGTVKQNIREDTEDLNNTINHFDLTDRILHLIT